MPDLPDVLDRLLTSYVPSALVLTAFVTTIAYIHSLRLKVLVFSMPIPFTCAYIATGGMPINATHVVGLFLVVLYHWVVFGARMGLRAPLGVAIGGGVTFYLTAAWLARPLADWPFWPLAGIWLAMYLVAARAMRGVDEPGHRSAAPWQVKAPTIFSIALVVYMLRDLLAGAVTTFPYAGVFTSYEMRRSLRTLATQFTINVISIASMIACMRATQAYLPGYWPLAVGWLAVFATLGVIYGLGLGKPPGLAVEAGDQPAGAERQAAVMPAEDAPGPVLAADADQPADEPSVDAGGDAGPARAPGEMAG